MFIERVDQGTEYKEYANVQTKMLLTFKQRKKQNFDEGRYNGDLSVAITADLFNI